MWALTRHGTKDAIGLHYGKRRIQWFWSFGAAASILTIFFLAMCLLRASLMFWQCSAVVPCRIHIHMHLEPITNKTVDWFSLCYRHVKISYSKKNTQNGVPLLYHCKHQRTVYKQIMFRLEVRITTSETSCGRLTHDLCGTMLFWGLIWKGPEDSQIWCQQTWGYDTHSRIRPTRAPALAAAWCNRSTSTSYSLSCLKNHISPLMLTMLRVITANSKSAHVLDILTHRAETYSNAPQQVSAWPN